MTTRTEVMCKCGCKRKVVASVMVDNSALLEVFDENGMQADCIVDLNKILPSKTGLLERVKDYALGRK